MAEVPRNKGEFVQAGMICIFPSPGGAVVTHDGTVALDALLTQTDYPFLFEVIGTTYNDPLKGDDAATQFRTPPTDGLPTLGPEYQYRMRF